MMLLASISALIIFLLLAKPLTEFAIEYLSDLTVKRILGGILFLVGAWLVVHGQQTGNIDKLMLFGALGILVGGTGAVVIYLDIANRK